MSNMWEKDYTVKIWSVNKEEVFEYGKQRHVEFQGEVEGMEEGEILLEARPTIDYHGEVTEENYQDVPHTLGKREGFEMEEVRVKLSGGRFNCRLPMLFEAISDPVLPDCLFAHLPRLPCIANSDVHVELFDCDGELVYYGMLKSVRVSLMCVSLEMKRKVLEMTYMESHKESVARILHMKRSLSDIQKETESAKEELTKHEKKAEEIQRAIEEKRLVLEENERMAAEVMEKLAKETLEMNLKTENYVNQQMELSNAAENESSSSA